MLKNYFYLLIDVWLITFVLKYSCNERWILNNPFRNSFQTRND